MCDRLSCGVGGMMRVGRVRVTIMRAVNAVLAILAGFVCRLNVSK